MYGPGVEKIYEELKVLFPKKNIKIFSSDFLSKKGETELILKKIEKNGTAPSMVYQALQNFKQD